MAGKLPPGNNANNREVQAYQDSKTGVVTTKPVGKFRNRNVKTTPSTNPKVGYTSHEINALKKFFARSSSKKTVDAKDGHKPLAPSKVCDFMPEFNGQLEAPPTVEQAKRQLKEIYDHNRLHLKKKEILADLSYYLARELNILNKVAIEFFDKGKNRNEFIEKIQSINETATKRLYELYDEKKKANPLNTEYAKSIASEFNAGFDDASHFVHSVVKELQAVKEISRTLEQEKFMQFCTKNKEWLSSWTNEEQQALIEIQNRLASLEQKAKGSYGTVQSFDSGQLSTKKDSKMLHKRYALKSQKLGSPDEPALYDSEINMAAQSSSPVVLHTSGKVGEEFLMLMDDGGSDLFSILDFKDAEVSKNPVSNGLKKAVLKSAADQLLVLHQNNIVHRDIKLANILMNASTGEVGLIDYGFSEQSDSDNYHGFYGTCSYAAPEVKEDYYTKKADVFSLGVVFYEILTGRLSKLDLEVMDENEHKKECTEMVNNVAREYGDHSLEYQLINQMLEYNPEKRLSMRDIVEHPFFYQAKKSYAELNAIHRAKIKEMGKMETDFKEKNQTIENNENYQKLRKDLRALQNALQWHELESQKNTVDKSRKSPKKAHAESAGHLSDQERQNVIDDINRQQLALLIQADDYL